MLKFGVCAVELGDGIGVAVERAVELFADHAAGKALPNFRRVGILALSAAKRSKQPLGATAAFQNGFEIALDLLQVRVRHQREAEPVAPLEHQLKMPRAEADFVGLDPAIRLHVGRAEHAVHILIFAGDAQAAKRTFAVFAVGIQNGQGIQRIFHLRLPHTGSRDNWAARLIGSRAKRREAHGKAAAYQQAKASADEENPESGHSGVGGSGADVGGHGAGIAGVSERENPTRGAGVCRSARAGDRGHAAGAADICASARGV